MHQKIALFARNLVNTKDESGHFLLKLPDGRIISTKGWNDWEWTHGMGLYGLYQYWSLLSSSQVLKVITSRFAAAQ